MGSGTCQQLASHLANFSIDNYITDHDQVRRLQARSLGFELSTLPHMPEWRNAFRLPNMAGEAQHGLHCRHSGRGTASSARCQTCQTWQERHSLPTVVKLAKHGRRSKVVSLAGTAAREVAARRKRRRGAQTSRLFGQRVWPTCLGGSFAARRQEIRARMDRASWEAYASSLLRGDNIEEGHYAERLWGAFLAPPLPLRSFTRCGAPLPSKAQSCQPMHRAVSHSLPQAEVHHVALPTFARQAFCFDAMTLQIALGL